MRTASTISAFCFLGASSTAPAQVSFAPVGQFHHGGYSYTTSLSPDGNHAAGYASNLAGNTESVRWTRAQGLTGLGMPATISFSAAQAITNSGVVVGYNQSLSQNRYFAYRWTEGAGFQDLGDLPGGSRNNLSMAVSDDGATVIGYGNYASSVAQGFVWTQAAGIRGIGDLPGGSFFSQASGVSGDGRVVVGGSSNSVDWGAFRWTESEGIQPLGYLSGGTYSHAYDASFDGSVIVGGSFGAGGGEAFRWTTAGMIGLGDLPGGTHGSTAFAVSNDGSVIVGRSSTGEGFDGNEAFVWDATNGMRNLRLVLEQAGLDLTGWVLTSAESVSADGTVIAGHGTNPAGLLEGWVAVIPAPGVLVLFGGALCVVCPTRRSRAAV